MSSRRVPPGGIASMWRVACGVALATSTACGPKVDASTATTDTDVAGDSNSGTHASETAADGATSTGLIDPYCPCDWIEPPRSVCQPTRTEVVVAERSAIQMAPMPDRSSWPIVAVDGALLVEVSPLEGPDTLQRWMPGDGAFAEVLAIEDEFRIEAMVAATDTLLLLMTRNNDNGEDVLARWTMGGGLEPIVGLGSLDASRNTDSDNWQRIRVATDRALFGVPTEDFFGVAAPDTFAVVEVDLVGGTYELLAEPLSGYAPTDDGWIGLRPQLAPFQYCFDTGCFNEDIATAWDLIAWAGAMPSTLATGHCVEDDLFGTLVGHAWLLGTDYVFTTSAAVRRLSNGEQVDLWRGDATVVGAVLHEDALFVSVSGDPEKQVLRIPLDGGPVESLLRGSPEDERDHYRLAGVLDERLYFASPLGDFSWELVAIDL